MIISLILGELIVTGCAGTISRPSPTPGQSRPPRAKAPVQRPRAKAPVQPPRDLNPRVMASLRLTQEGKMLLECHKPDEAINLLERAISLNPTHGQNYFYLSEAWLIKGNGEQAEEFNRLADVYLHGNQDWIFRVMQQKDRILELLKNN